MSPSRQRRLLQENRSRPKPIPATSKPQNGTQTRVNLNKPPKPANLLQAVQQAAAPVVSKLQAAQQQFRQATSFIEPVERLVESAAAKSDYLPSDIAGTGAAILAERAGVPPAALLPLGLLTGAVHKAGPRKGTVKQSGALRTKYPDQIDALEDSLETVYKNTNAAGGKLSQAYPPNQRTVHDFGDGTEAYAFNGGNFNYDNRDGIRLKTRPSTNKPNPLPNVSTKVEAPKPNPLPNVSTPVQATKPAPIPPSKTTGPNRTPLDPSDPVDRLLLDRELEYQGGMEIYRNDMLTREAEVDKLLSNPALDGKARDALQNERRDLRRARRSLASEPPNTSSAYMYENDILNKPSNLQGGLSSDLINSETKARNASRPIPSAEAHHNGSVSSTESYVANMSAADMRETTGLLTEQGYGVGSNPYKFMPLSRPAHTGGLAGDHWGQDFAHVGGEGRFKADALPKGTTPQQAAEAMKPMLNEQRVLNTAAWNHPAEAAMRQYVEGLMGKVDWNLPAGQKNNAKQVKAAKNLGINANEISRAFSDGFAAGKTYEQIAEELSQRLTNAKPKPKSIPR